MHEYYQEAVALGSKTGISLVSQAAPALLEQVFRDLWRRTFLFERQFSRFLPASELSTFNRNAGTKQAITVEFRDILVAAHDMAHATGGLYNPFILPAVQAAGYTHSRVPGHEQDAVDNHAGKSVVPVERLEIGTDWARIPYGTALDLGGCGKGYLADMLRSSLPSSIAGYWLSFGGDIAVGGQDAHNQPWTVSIERADSPTKSIGTYTATAPVGVATSGTTVHRGKKAGKTWHHLIDPRTRKPAQTDVLLATVCDDFALRADVLASCAVILGGTRGLQFLKEQKVKAAVLQCQTPQGMHYIEHYGNGIMITNTHA